MQSQHYSMKEHAIFPVDTSSWGRFRPVWRNMFNFHAEGSHFPVFKGAQNFLPCLNQRQKPHTFRRRSQRESFPLSSLPLEKRKSRQAPNWSSSTLWFETNWDVLGWKMFPSQGQFCNARSRWAYSILSRNEEKTIIQMNCWALIEWNTKEGGFLLGKCESIH